MILVASANHLTRTTALLHLSVDGGSGGPDFEIDGPRTGAMSISYERCWTGQLMFKPIILATLLLAGCSTSVVEGLVVEVDSECSAGRPQIDRNWIVFFDRDSSALTQRGRLVTRELASVFRSNHGTVMIVSGHIDGQEQASSKHNLGLRRAEAVATVLAEEGIEKQSIVTRDAVFSAPRVPTTVGVSESQNRYTSLTPIGVNEGYERFAARCKTVIQKSCFGSISSEQRKRCGDALDMLVPPG